MSVLETIGGAATGKWNDADLIGDFFAPEVQALLDRSFMVLVGKSSTQKRGTWRIWKDPLRNMIDVKLSRHEIRRFKDGDSIVFANARPTGEFSPFEEGGIQWPLCGRARNDIKELSFVGFDVDDGEPLEVVKDRLTRLGKFAILYTTHSHGKLCPKSGRKLNKYRILFPLEHPFQLNPERSGEHSYLIAYWRDWLTKFAKRELEIDIDESGCDVNRLFYTPRHKPYDADWDLTIFAGPALHIDGAPERTEETSRVQRGRRAKRHVQPKRPRPILSDGFDLIDWRIDWGRHFQVCDFFENLQWEMGSHDPHRGEARMLCPNDDAHSAQDDRHGCWIKDGDGENAFAIHCHHNSCRQDDLRSLEQLVILDQQVDIPDEYETLSQMLCDPAYYSAEAPSYPDHKQFLRWDARPGKETNTKGMNK